MTTKAFSYRALGGQIEAASEHKAATLAAKAAECLKTWKGFPIVDKLSASSVAEFKLGAVESFAKRHPVLHYTITSKSGSKVKRASLRDPEARGVIEINVIDCYNMDKSGLRAIKDSPNPEAVAQYNAVRDARHYLQKHASDLLNDLCDAGLTDAQREKLGKAKKGRGASKSLQDRIAEFLNNLAKPVKAANDKGNAPFSVAEYNQAVAEFKRALHIAK